MIITMVTNPLGIPDVGTDRPEREIIRSQRDLVVIPTADVKQVRRLMGLTQAQLAARLGTSSPTVERLESSGANEMQRLALIGLAWTMQLRPAKLAHILAFLDR